MSEKKRTRAIDPSRILCRTIDSTYDNKTYFPFHLKPENLDMQPSEDTNCRTKVKCAVCGEERTTRHMDTSLDLFAKDSDGEGALHNVYVCVKCFQAGFDRQDDYQKIIWIAKEFKNEHSNFRGRWMRLQSLLFEMPKTCEARVARYNESHTALEPVGTFDHKNWYKLDRELRNAKVLRIDASMTEPNPDEFQHGVLEVLIE